MSTADRETNSALRPRMMRRSPIWRGSATYYAALGYGAPYQWAHYAQVPFQPLGKPLSAMPHRAGHHRGALPAGQGRPGSGRALQRGGQVLHRLFRRHGAGPRPAHLARRHRPHAHDGRGPRQLLPARPRCAAPAQRRPDRRRSPRASTACPPTAAIAPRSRSTAARWSRAARPTASTPPCSVPNCPVCHQSVSLAARALEESGIATVVMGCAKDIVEHVGVPRFLFSDFPLGNAAGRPHDARRRPRRWTSRLRVLETRAGAAHHRAVAAGVDRQSRLEARLLQHRTALRRRDRGAPRGVRPGQSGGQDGARNRITVAAFPRQTVVPRSLLRRPRYGGIIGDQLETKPTAGMNNKRFQERHDGGPGYADLERCRRDRSGRGQSHPR